MIKNTTNEMIRTVGIIRRNLLQMYLSIFIFIPCQKTTDSFDANRRPEKVELSSGRRTLP
jgi:hypothetical protein